MKKYDWIVAGIGNPDMNISDFRNSGMDIDNTQLLSKEEYLKSSFIKDNDLFKNDNGLFSETKFNEYYNQKLSEFDDFRENQDPYQFDPGNIIQYTRSNPNIKDLNINFYQFSNPTEKTIGNSFVNEVVESPFSIKELAQKNKIKDFKTGEALDVSPNEMSLFNNPIKYIQNLFSEPLVLATYDEDGIDIDPITGIPFRYSKGDLKLNENGKYYYETLGDRSSYNKQLLSNTDILTVDGTGLNSIDFFDADGKDKSISSIIVNNVVKIAPLFIGGKIQLLYTAALTGREILKTLPMLDGLFSSFTGNNEDTMFSKISNNLASKAKQATGGKSEYSEKNILSFENLSQLMTDVALQWGQQKMIARCFSSNKKINKIKDQALKNAEKKWKDTNVQLKNNIINSKQATSTQADIIYGTDEMWQMSNYGQKLISDELALAAKEIEKSYKFGKDAALMYMAAVSNADVYEEMLESGLTKREATAVAFGSMLGMYYVDKKLGLGEMFFDELAETAHLQTKHSLKDIAKRYIQAMKNMVKDTSEDPKKLNLLQKAYKTAKKVYNDYRDDLKYHTTGALGKMIGEGLEEVSEELSSDMSKQLYEWAAQIKPIDTFFNDLTTDNVNAFNDAFENPYWVSQTAARYGMNFLGGFLGGGIFYGKSIFDGHLPIKRNTSEDDLLHAVRNHGKSFVLKELNRMRDNHELGSVKKSAIFETVDGETGTFLSPSEKHITQNDYVYNIIKNNINSIDEIINDKTEIKSDLDLLKNMTMGEKRFQELIGLTNGDYDASLIERYKDIVTEYFNVQKAIKNIENNPNKIDSKKNDLTDFDLRRLEKLKQRRDQLSEKIKNFDSVENAIDYMGMITFNLDENLYGIFESTPNFKAWLESHKKDSDGISHMMSIEDFEKLNSTEKQVLLDEFIQYKNSPNFKQDQELSWYTFKTIRDYFTPELVNIQDSVKDSEDIIKRINDILGENSPFNKINVDINAFSEDAEEPLYRINYDLPYFGESQQIFESRNQLPEESDEDFKERRNKRLEILKNQRANALYEEQLYQAWENVLNIIQNAGGIIDPSAKNRLLLFIGQNKKEILKNIIQSNPLILKYPKLSSRITELLDQIKPDFSNFDIQKNFIKEEFEKYYNEKIDKELDGIFSFISIDPFELENNKIKNGPKQMEEKINKSFDSQEKIINAFVSIGFINPDENWNNLSQEEKNNRAKILYWKVKAYYESKTGKEFSSLRRINKIEELFNYLKEFSHINLTNSEKNTIQTIFSFKSEIVGQNDNSSFVFNEYAENKLFIDILFIPIKTDDKFVIIGDKDGIDYEYYKQWFKLFYNRNINFEKINIKKLIQPTLDGQISFEAMFEYLNKYELEGKEYDLDLFSYKWIEDEEEFGFESPYEALVKSGQLTQLFDKLATDVDNVKVNAEKNKNFNIITKIESFTESNNPVLDLLYKLKLYLNPDGTDIRTVLFNLRNAVKNNDFSQFTLSKTEQSQLDEIVDLLKLAKGLIYSAYDTRNPQNPYPHNQFINQMIQKHNAKIDLLPEIDKNIVNLYYHSIFQLEHEIGILNEKTGLYNSGSFKAINAINELNKSKKYFDAFIKNVIAKNRFFKFNKDLFTLKINKKTISLLDGFEELPSLDESDPVSIYNIENLIYANFQKIKKQTGLSAIQILDKTNLFKLFESKQYEIEEQLTSSLDENIDYSKMTVMSKLAYLQSILCISAKDANIAFESFLQDKPQFAALDIQQHVSRSGLAEINDTQTFYEIAEWGYKEMSKISPNISKKIFLQGIFMSGNGGAGKSEVCIAIQLHYAKQKGFKIEEVFYSGPTDKQVNNLKEKNLFGKGISIEELVDKISTEKDLYKKVVDEIESGKTSDLKYIECNEKTTVISLKEVKTKSKKDAGISFIVIDEATHLPTPILQLISEYSNKNNVPLIYVGDNLQCGSTKKNGTFPCNLSQESAFIMRTSRLGLTLRDSNIQKFRNINSLVQHLTNILTVPDNHLKDESERKLLNELKQMELDYFENDKFVYGDLAVPEITTDLIKKLQPLKADNKHFIAYLGTNKDVVKMIKDIYGEDSVVEYDDVKKIQGSEFDHIIIDVNLNMPKDLYNQKNYTNTALFLQKIYTLSTRGKVSAIFVDKNKNLRNQIKFVKDPHKNDVVNFNSTIIKEFNAKYKSITDKYKSQANPTSFIQDLKKENSEEIASPTPVGTGIKGQINIDLDEEEEMAENATNEIKKKVAIDETEYEKEDTIYDLIGEYDQDRSFAMVYGENSLSGLPYTIEEFTFVDKNGNEHKKEYRKYKKPSNEQTEFRDLAIFIPKTNDQNDFLIYDSFERKHDISQYVNLLLDLKDSILYKTLYDDLSLNVKKLLKDGTIPQDFFENIEKYIFIEKSKYNPNTDNFIGLSQLSDKEEDMVIYEEDGNKYILKLVVKWNKDNKNNILTLGMLSNPTRFKNKLKYLIEEGIDKKIKILKEKLKLNEDSKLIQRRITRLEEFRKKNGIFSTVESKWEIKENENIADQYLVNLKNLFDNRANEEEQGFFKLPGNLIFTGNTEIRTLVRNKESFVRQRLSNSGLKEFGISPESFSFEESNPGVTFSNIYVAGNNGDTSYMRGNLCVFVTKDPSLKGRSNELKDIWCSSATNLSKRVRMLRLDALGASFSQLVTPKIRDLFVQRRDVNNFDSQPYDTQRMSIRMLVSLWNFRTSLIRFNEKLIKFKNNNNINSGNENDFDDLLGLIHDDYKLYLKYIDEQNQNNSEGQQVLPDENEFLNWIKNKYTSESNKLINKFGGLGIIDKIFQFNNEILSDVRQFRLGAGNITPIKNPQEGKKRNSWQIRSIKKPEDITNWIYINEYNKKKERLNKDNVNIYGIYITPTTAQNFLKMLDDIFKIAESKTGFNLKIKKKNEKGEYDIIEPKDYLLNKENEFNLSGSVNYISLGKEEEYSFFNGDTALQAKEFKQFSMFLIKVARKAAAYSKLKRNSDGILVFESENEVNKRYKTRSIEWVEKAHELEEISRYEENKNGTGFKVIKGEKIKINVSTLYHYGQDFLHMLELCFHGTTDDFISKRLKSNNFYKSEVTPQSEDAYFKYGFIVSPVISSKKNKNESRFYEVLNLNPALVTARGRIDRSRFGFYFDFRKDDTIEQIQTTEELKLTYKIAYEIISENGVENNIEAKNFIIEEVQRILKEKGVDIRNINIDIKNIEDSIKINKYQFSFTEDKIEVEEVKDDKQIETSNNIENQTEDILKGRLIEYGIREEDSNDIIQSIKVFIDTNKNNGYDKNPINEIIEELGLDENIEKELKNFIEQYENQCK